MPRDDQKARVVELVDTLALGASPPKTGEGSSPFPGTKNFAGAKFKE